MEVIAKADALALATRVAKLPPVQLAAFMAYLWSTAAECGVGMVVQPADSGSDSIARISRER